MADDTPRRGLNPNATSFVPNFGAKPFIPGQKIHSTQAADCCGDSPPAGAAPTAAAANAPTAAADVEQPAALSNGVAARSSEPPDDAAWDEAAAAEDADADDQVDEDADEEDEEEEEPSSASTDERPKPKAKKRLLSAEQRHRKDYVNVVFIGHVDAGKSTIGGHIMYLTGMIEKRTLDKYEREAKEKNRESWYLSWALDTNAEERDKGKTVEVGRAYFETDKKHFTILDAPGHKSFVPNMIGGACQADLAVLVISARRGEFDAGFERGGQTREHALLVKTAGVRHVVILVNKMDDPTVEWNEQIFDEIKEKLTPYMKKVGYNPKTDLFYIPCSGLTGAFLKERPSDGEGSWYTGPCFIEYIDSIPSISRQDDGPLRIVLVDKYNDMGTLVLGKVESGNVSKGQTLLLMPNRVSVQVLQIWSDDVETDEAISGENVKLKLKGVEEEDILGGFVLCSTDSQCHVGRIFDAQVAILELKSIMCPGFTAVLHIHTAVEEIKVSAILCLIDRKTGDKVKGARFVKQDQTCIMRIESADLFCLEAFKDFPQMGRFTLRDEGRTIAIGKVLKVIE